jgi:hypothetical protein
MLYNIAITKGFVPKPHFKEMKDLLTLLRVEGGIRQDD